MSLWLPGHYVGQVHPSGLNATAYRKIDANIDRSGFKRIGYKDTQQGRILVAEKRQMHPSCWIVWWFVREFACKLECSPQTSQGQRFDAAIAHAESVIRDRAGVMGDA